MLKQSLLPICHINNRPNTDWEIQKNNKKKKEKKQ